MNFSRSEIHKNSEHAAIIEKKSSVMTPEELKEVFIRAKKAQPLWQGIGTAERIKYFSKVSEFIDGNIDLIVDTINKDNGKTKIDAISAEVIPIAVAIKYYSKLALEELRDKKIKSASALLSFKRSILHRVPYGIVGIISPWNYPFTIPMFDIIPGLMAGNSIILKAASETQNVAGIIAQAFTYAGIPEGVFNLVNMKGKQFGESILELGVDKLFFTGSVEAGKYLSRMAADKLIPVSLELGGNDPMIVCDDADIERAVNGAIWGGYHNAGQSCGGIERVYVDQKVYDVFLNLLKIKVESMRVTEGSDITGDMGAITTSGQFESINSQVDDALRNGAVLFAKSKIDENTNGRLMPAMVLTEVNHGMKIMKEETFGPVLCVMKVGSVEEAVDLSNDSNFGLSASVWTNSNKRGYEIAKKIKAGAVNINDHLMSHGLAETPWGGFKQSGNSRSHGIFGLHSMTQTQVIIKDILPFVKRSLWWHPYSEKLYNGLKDFVHLINKNSIAQKAGSVYNVIKLIPRIFK